MELEHSNIASKGCDLIRLERKTRLPIAIVQFGVWYTQSDSPTNHGRTFSVEYERECSTAYIKVAHEHSLICIIIRQRETKVEYLILIAFSSIRQLEIGRDGAKLPIVIFDLHTPPIFEKTSNNNRVSEGTQREGRYKTHDRISALDDAHARIAPYAHQLRIVLADQHDFEEFEAMCQDVKCHIPSDCCVGACAMRFFRKDFMDHVFRWTQRMAWNIVFQIEAYLRSGLLTTHDLLVSLRKPIESVIIDYGSEANEFLRLFSSALRTRSPSETPNACIARVRAESPTIKPLKLAKGHILCHHVIIMPSRILLEGPYPTQSNRVIRGYKSHDPTLVERFVRVEFRDEDHLPYRWGITVDGTLFLQQRVGDILRKGFEIGGRRFEFLGYSISSLRDHTVWFISPFRHPSLGFVNAERVRASLGDFSKLLRTPSKYAARMAQGFTSTDPGVKIRWYQWEEQPDLGPHTDGVGTISPQLADMIWDERCRAIGNLKENCIKPSAYQFRFLGYKGVVVVDTRLKGIKMRLRNSQRKFPVHNIVEAEFEIARSFDYPNPVHLNRPAIMALEDLGVKKEAFMHLQEAATQAIFHASDSLESFADLLKSHGLGDMFRLASILEQLAKLGHDLKDYLDREVTENAFLGRLVHDLMKHSLREVKFKARIPVPHSYQLVGVADEGQAYINEGANPDKVFTLKEGFVYACVQESADKDPVYFKGFCLISRSPVIHPGDVQRVYAVGKPPQDKICFFRDLKNVVVFPAIGHRSLASCLAGGDLDGDTYDVYYENPSLLPPMKAHPADYPPGEVWTLDEGRGNANVEDICDHIVEFINSDHMGLLANRHLIIADQSKDGVFDERCMKLAALCSKAVDYAKNGKPVDLHNLPRSLTRLKPDWHKTEVTVDTHDPDYYESDRALGHLFRAIDLRKPYEHPKGIPTTSPKDVVPLEDPITRALAPLVRYMICQGDRLFGSVNAQAQGLHARYVREMRYICMTHTLIDSPDICLNEEEVVLGTILANCTQPRWRSDRTQRMRLHSEMLVRDMRSHIMPDEGPPAEPQLREGLRSGWAMWSWARHHRDEEFIDSFSLITLGVIFDCLERLGALQDI